MFCIFLKILNNNTAQSSIVIIIDTNLGHDTKCYAEDAGEEKVIEVGGGGPEAHKHGREHLEEMVRSLILNTPKKSGASAEDSKFIFEWRIQIQILFLKHNFYV